MTCEIQPIPSITEKTLVRSENVELGLFDKLPQELFDRIFDLYFEEFEGLKDKLGLKNTVSVEYTHRPKHEEFSINDQGFTFVVDDSGSMIPNRQLIHEVSEVAEKKYRKLISLVFSVALTCKSFWVMTTEYRNCLNKKLDIYKELKLSSEKIDSDMALNGFIRPDLRWKNETKMIKNLFKKFMSDYPFDFSQFNFENFQITKL